jgi:hypothetical protein
LGFDKAGRWLLDDEVDRGVVQARETKKIEIIKTKAS